MDTSTPYATKPKPTHREETPVRSCMECGAYLRTGNLSTTCDPCGTPPWEIVEDSDLWDALVEADHHGRKAILTELEQVMA